MLQIVRHIGLYFRRRSEQRRIGDALRQYEEWSQLIAQLPSNESSQKHLAIVRMDDIGDYILWRNSLSSYKSAPKYAAYRCTLIGNRMWKAIFEAYDADSVDEVIWVDKQRYLKDTEYRMHLWKDIRSKSFETVICPTRTRPLHIDDTIVLAAGAKSRIANANTFQFASLNAKSDAHYTQLFTGKKEEHEFYFNRSFAEYICETSIAKQQLSIPIASTTAPKVGQVICFIGAAVQSKTWDLDYWIALVNMLQEAGYKPLLSGGKNEMPIAEKVIAATKADSIVGKTDLVASIEAIAQSEAVISGDTMAAHVAMALAKPTIIIANGVNAKRFVAYEEAGFSKVKTIYTQQYLRSKKETFYSAVSKDMHSIKPSTVFAALGSLTT